MMKTKQVLRSAAARTAACIAALVLAGAAAAPRIDPGYAAAYVGRGAAYYENGDYNRAIADYTAALRIKPDYAAAYYNRGYVYYYNGDYNRAVADFTAALRIDPDDTATKKNLETARRARGY
jgi:tetratricopeptide (TPR) repeat protein